VSGVGVGDDLYHQRLLPGNGDGARGHVDCVLPRGIVRRVRDAFSNLEFSCTSVRTVRAHSSERSTQTGKGNSVVVGFRVNIPCRAYVVKRSSNWQICVQVYTQAPTVNTRYNINIRE
jgi:hypothetical protein